MKTVAALAVTTMTLVFAGCSDDGGASPSTPSGHVDLAATCTDPSMFQHSCAASFFGSCWDPSGACTLDFGLVGAKVHWANGARADATADLSAFLKDPAHPKVAVEVIGSSGAECARGSVGDAPGCVGETTYQNEHGSLKVCVLEDLSMRVTCPDGSTFNAPPGSQNCIYGQTTASCKVATGLEEPDAG